MSEESTLIVIAEIAVAIAGFSGIAAAFGRRQERAWSRAERARLGNLLNHSGIALFAALVPLVFAQRGGYTADLWRNSSLLWAAFASLGIASSSRSFVSHGAAAIRRSSIPLAGFGSLLVLQLCNALLWKLAWPYFLGLVGNLAFAFVQFMVLVNPSADSDTD